MQNVKFAGFWIRFLAYFIDSIIMTVGAMILIVPMILFLGVSFDSMDRYGDGDLDPEVVAAIILVYVGIFVISILANWLYFALFESSARQATPGKIAVGVRVVGPQGSEFHLPGHRAGRSQKFSRG